MPAGAAFLESNQQSIRRKIRERSLKRRLFLELHCSWRTKTVVLVLQNGIMGPLRRLPNGIAQPD